MYVMEEIIMFKKEIKRVLIIILLVTLCFFFIACDFYELMTANDVEKYDAYVELNNYMVDWLDKTIINYCNVFGDDEEIIMPKKFFSFSTYPILQVHKDIVEKAFVFSTKKPSYGAIDTSVDNLYSPLKELMLILEEIENYYRDEAFLQDDFVKGKELHKQFYHKYIEYLPLASDFLYDLRIIVEESKQEDLERLKEEDYMITYTALKIIYRAQEMQEMLYDLYYEESTIDYNLFKEHYNLLSEDIEDYINYSKDESRRKKENLIDDSAGIYIFTRHVKDMHDNATKLIEILNVESFWEDEEALFDYIEDFNTRLSYAIDLYNTML